MSRKRYVLEGEWSGYKASQRRVVHREVTTTPKQFEHLSSIEYTDGTLLILSLRPCEPRERVDEYHGYTRLIRDAALLGKSHVQVRELRQ